MGAIETLKTPQIGLFTAQTLNHPYPGDVFLEAGVDLGQSHAHLAKGAPSPRTPVEGEQEHRWDNSKRGEGQQGVYGQHHDENPTQSEEVAQRPNMPLVKRSCRLPTSFW